jgi:hypothetical protein
MQTGHMADEQSTPENVDPTPGPVEHASVVAPEAPRTRWQDRVLRLPSVIAVALATLIVGGFAGAGFGAWLHHDHGRFDGPGRTGHMGQFGDGRHHGEGWGMGPGRDGDHAGWGQPGQPGWGQQGQPGWGQQGQPGSGQQGQPGSGQNTAPTPPSASPSQNG